VPDLLEDYRGLGGEQFQLVEAVRGLVRQTISAVTEEVKYGGILFESGMPFGGVLA